MKRDVSISLPVVASICLLLAACSGGSGESEQRGAGRVIPAVEAVQAEFGSLPLTERLSGVVKAKNEVEIYPEVSTVVSAVHVENGDRVGRGDPLVSLRSREFSERLKQAQAGLQIAEAQAKQAEARMNEAKADLVRAESLAEQDMITEAELETARTEAISTEADYALAKARVAQAQATVDERQEALEQTVIRSPVDGVVGNRRAEVGMLVGNNTRLFTVGQLDTVRVQVVLTDRMLSYLETGQRAEIQSDALPPGIVSAQLSRISPFLHPVAHSTDAEIDLDNPEGDLKSGMFVTVDIFYGESENATLVPVSSLYENPNTGATGVYITRDSLSGEAAATMNTDETIPLTEPVGFEFVPVEVVAKGRMEAGVRGVDPNMWVVTIGQDLLAGGAAEARVRPVSWSRVENIQKLQREDLLQEIMKKQQQATSMNPDSIGT